MGNAEDWPLSMLTSPRAVTFQDNVIPRAVEWFTGEIAPFPEDDEYYEDEEGEPEYEPPPPPGKRR